MNRFIRGRPAFQRTRLSAFLGVAIAFIATSTTQASWREIQVEVISLSERAPNHFVLTFDTAQPKQRFVVHLRYDPRRLSRQAHEHYTRAKYDEAIAILRRQFATSPRLSVGLESEKGFLPVPNRPGEYRSEALDIRDGVVIAVPSDLG